jgi:hypothetical protein
MSEKTMTGTKRTASAIIAVALGIAVVGTLGLSLHKLSADPQGKLVAKPEAGTINVNGKDYPKATIEMGVYADNGQAEEDKSGLAVVNKNDWVHFGPATHLVLPANTYITMTIRAYDGGEKLNNAFFGKVVGTVGGTMNVDGKDVTELTDEQVQHTFTLHGIPSAKQDSLFVNVPLLRVEEGDDGFLPTTDPGTGKKGHTITFSFLTKGKGEYVFNCEYPCGDGTYSKFGAAMSAYGYMSGKVTVA